MGWIMFLLILGLLLAGVGLVVETFQWLLIIALLALLTGGLVGWSRRTTVSLKPIDRTGWFRPTRRGVYDFFPGTESRRQPHGLSDTNH